MMELTPVVAFAAYCTLGLVLMLFKLVAIIFVDDEGDVLRFPSMVATMFFWLPFIIYCLVVNRCHDDD